MRRAMRTLLCALGLRWFCPASEPKRRPELDRVRERQREIAERAEALGIRVEVTTRRYGDGASERLPN